MSVHYKFKSTLDYNTVSFDALHISVADLKKAIFHQKRIGKNTDFDLQITNAQTKEDYTDDNALIAKNTSLIVARVPLTVQQKRTWDRNETPSFSNSKEETTLSRSVDLTRLDGSEDDKIRAMMSQSTQDYDPSNYMKIRGANQTGDVPQNYRCYKCHQPGHWIKNCPLGSNSEPIEIKKSTGIPRSFMVPVEGPLVPGAMMTPTGHYAVPAIDHQAYKEGKKERPPFSQDPEPVVEKPEIPENLLCNICKDLLTDAVMIPCCGNSFCDECIRTFLLESEEHECPDCNEKDVSPESMIPNRYLRNAVANFKNKTGYAKRVIYKSPPIPKVVPVIQTEPSLIEKPPAVLPVSAMIQANSAAKSAKSAPLLESPKPSADASSSTSSTKEFDKVTSTFEVDSPILYEKSTMSTTGAIPESTSESDLQSDSVTKLTTDEETEVPPPPGTEPPLLPKRPADSDKDVFNSEARDDEHCKDRERYQRERRRSFSKDHRDRMNYHGNRIDSNIRGNRRRSLSPRNTHHDYQMHPGNQHQKNYQGHQPDGRYHPPMHYDPNMRRSTDDRAGTPTVDEPHLHGPPPPQTPVGQPPLLPFPPGEDRVPPPAYNQPPHPAPMPPHNPPLLPDPYMPPHRMNMYPHQQPAHYGPPPRFDRPPYQQSGYRPNHPPRNYNGPRPMRGMHNRYRGIQPPPPGMGRNLHNGNQGVIDDPLEAFERMLREKDERDRRMGKRRRHTRSRSRSRSYSRSRSRSFTRRSPPARERPSRSRSPPAKRRSPRSPPPHRVRSRTPKRRSRSGSFSISRSRSFSRSQSPRGSLPRDRERDRERDRDRNRDAPPPRYKSPARSPGRFQRDRDRERERPRSREAYNTYYNEGTAPEYSQYRDRDRDSSRSDRSRYSSRSQAPQHNIPPLMPPILGPPAGVHQQPISTMGHLPPDRKDYYDSYNRYSGPQGQRFNSPLANTSHKRFDDVAPPGTEGYYDLPPPGVDHPEKPTRDERPRSGKDDAKDSAKDSHRSDDRGHERDRREKDDRERGPSTKDHDRSRDKEERDRRDKDKERDDRHTRDRRDDDRNTDRRDSDKYKDDRDRHRGEEKNRGRDRRERDYEVEVKRHSDRHVDERKKSKRSPSPYSSKYRDTREVTPAERPKKKEKDHEEKEADKKKEKKIKDKKKKKDSDEKEKKKKKKKEKKAIIQKEAAAAAAAAAALVANVAVKQEPTESAEKPAFEVTKEMIARVASSIKAEPDDKQPPKETNKLNPEDFDMEMMDTLSNTNAQSMGSAEPDASPKQIDGAEPGANPPNPNFKPIPELRSDNKTKTKEEEADAPKQDIEEKSPVIENLYDGLEEMETDALENPKETQAEEGEIEDDDEDDDKIDGDTPSSPKVEEFLAPVPELSKWERDDNPDKDDVPESSEREMSINEDTKASKVVTTEVLKRAEKAIFQKAINAIIRPPIEIKKISESRKGLYQNPEPKILEPEETRKGVNVTINVGKNERNVEISEPPKKPKSERNKFKTEGRASPTRLSAKDRLGEKIDDIRVEQVPIKFADRREAKAETQTTVRSPKIKDRRVSLTIEDNSPPITNTERKVFIDDRKRLDRPRDRSLTSLRAESRLSERELRKLERGRTPPPLSTFKAELSRLSSLKRKEEEEEKEERRRKSREDKKRKKDHRSRSKSKDAKKRKDKKHKKDKEKSLERKTKHSRDIKEKSEETKVFEVPEGSEAWRKQRKNPRLVSDRKRSLVVDETNFEPDYSATDSDSDDEVKTTLKKMKVNSDIIEEPKRKKIKISSSEDEDSSSSESSSSDSDSSVESHRKKKKKHKKKKKRKAAKKDSSSDSDGYSDSSESSSEEEKHRKKSKKSKSKSKPKKKKKSKHK